MRTVTLRVMAIGLWMGFSAGGTWAAEGSDAGGNPVELDLWQAGYTIIVFLCLLGILGRFAFRPILASLKKREDFIRHSLEAAQQSREEAEVRLREHEARLQEARRQSAGMIEEARRDAEAARRRIEEEARRKSEEMIERARREIGLARDHALQSLFDETAELAAALAAAALHRQMTPEEHQRLVIEALRGLQAQERALR